MDNSTKILAGAACAVGVAAVGGLWLYGVWSAGDALDRAAMTNFEDVLPEGIKARVSQYDGAFWQKEFIVSLIAQTDASSPAEETLATFRGTARPGLRTSLELVRVKDAAYEKWTARNGIRDFDDRLEVSYTLWDSLRFTAGPLPRVRFAYVVKPFTIDDTLICRFEESRTEVESGDRVTLKTTLPGLECLQAGKEALKLGSTELTYASEPEAVAQALKGPADEPAVLADTEFAFKSGALTSPSYSHDSFTLNVTLKLEEGKSKPGRWTERLTFKLAKPVSQDLFLWFGPETKVDYVRADVSLTGITDTVNARVNDVVTGPWNIFEMADRMGYVLIESFLNLGVATEINPIEVSVNGQKAVLTGRVAGEKDEIAQKSEVTGRFDFHAPAAILPADKIQPLVDAGYLLNKDGEVTSSVVVTPSRVIVNGKELH